LPHKSEFDEEMKQKDMDEMMLKKRQAETIDDD